MTTLAYLTGSLAVAAAIAAPATRPAPTPIFGGDPAQECAWPSAVFVDLGSAGCTGTLIHPRVVIYAAHCSSRPSRLLFGQSRSGPARSVVPEHCAINQRYADTRDPEDDFAYCLLPEEITDVPITPVAMGCELDRLQGGSEVMIVGFGLDRPEGSAGTKRWTPTTVEEVQDGYVFIGNREGSACSGDSGGPAFLQQPDGTWRSVGIVSQGGSSCMSGAAYARPHRYLAWVESETGLDVTPCHTAEGEWDAGPACSGFYNGDGSGGGAAWANGCAELRDEKDSRTCGPPHELGPDDIAPTVAITSPSSGTRFDEVPTTIPIEVEANDEGEGLARVSLSINDTEVGFLRHPPFVFPNVRFPEGEFIVRVVAEDWAGHETHDRVAIGVGQDAPALPPEPDPPDATTDGGGTDSGSESGSDPDQAGAGRGCREASDVSRLALLTSFLFLGRRRRARS